MDKVTLTCILYHVKEIASGKLLYNTGSSMWCSVTTYRDEIGLEEGWWVGKNSKRERTCTLMTDSCCYMVEAKTTL